LPGNNASAPFFTERKIGSLRATGSSVVSSKASTSVAKLANGYHGCCSTSGPSQAVSMAVICAKNASHQAVPSCSTRSESV